MRRSERLRASVVAAATTALLVASASAQTYRRGGRVDSGPRVVDASRCVETSKQSVLVYGGFRQQISLRNTCDEVLRCTVGATNQSSVAWPVTLQAGTNLAVTTQWLGPDTPYEPVLACDRVREGTPPIGPSACVESRMVTPALGCRGLPGYVYAVEVHNGCGTAMRCEVATTVDSTPYPVEVPVGGTRVVSTGRCPPLSYAFTPVVACVSASSVTRR